MSDQGDIIERLGDHVLYNKKERCALFIEARNEIATLRNHLAAAQEFNRAYMAQLAIAGEHIAEMTDQLASARKALEPFATAARAFTSAIAPDGIDDGITLEVTMHGRPHRHATMSTADFSRAAAALTDENGK